MSKIRKFNGRLIASKLGSLGRSGKQVAASLKRRHVKGLNSGSNTCPVATYLKRFLPVELQGNLSVDSERITVEGTGNSRYDGWGWTSPQPLLDRHTSKAVAQFINDYDDGKYPELRQ